MSNDAPRRVPNNVSIDVWLTRHAELEINTWYIIGSKGINHHTNGTIRLSAEFFRKHLAYNDNQGQIRMDDGSDLNIGTFAVFGILGDIRLGDYLINLDRRHCSCKSYQYLKTERGDRNCKHLNSLCRPSYIVTYTKKNQAFQLISEHVPKNPSVYMDWIYSQKYDGIRVLVTGTSAWTRFGMKIDLSSIWTPPPGHTYDAELCIIGKEYPVHNHDVVLSCILSGKIHSLRLLIFDLYDPTGVLTCGQRLLRLWGLPIPDLYLVRYQMVHLRKGPSFHTRLSQLNIGSDLCEGVIVRNPDTVYDGSGKRTSRSVFKVKTKQWTHLRVR